MRNKTTIAAALSAAALGLTACAQGSASTPGAPVANAKPALLTGQVRAVSAGKLSAVDIGTAQRAFGLDVLQALCAKSGGTNVTLSPSSLADALGLLDAGSAGASRTAMGQLLHLPAWSDDVVAAQQARTAAIAKLNDDPNAKVVTSNHIWAQAGTKPTQRYLDDVKTAFDADLHSVDFAGHSHDATDTINASVKKDTDGMIEKLFDSDLDPSTVDVLTNAVVLDAKWQTSFEPHSPNGSFTTAAGNTVQVPMMSAADTDFAWTSADGWQAATLPYKGNTLSAVAILPPASTTTCAAPSDATLTKLLGPSQGRTAVQMPKLKLEQTHSDLLATLTGLGLPTEGFPGIFQGASVSFVIQKVVMDVDEQGTKAAAATGIGMATSARMVSHQLTLDRPYLLLIRDTATGSPLFLTWVGDPTQP